jgi:hypothetical protein
MYQEGPLRRLLRERRTIILPKPLIAYFQLFITHPVTVKVDAGVEEEIRRKRDEWAARGIPKNIQDMAVEMAREWATSLTEFQLRMLEHTLPKEELERVANEIARKLLRTALDTTAENWVRRWAGR